MGGYLLRRLALILPTLLGILLINFAIVQAAPGGPVDQAIARAAGRRRRRPAGAWRGGWAWRSGTAAPRRDRHRSAAGGRPGAPVRLRQAAAATALADAVELRPAGFRRELLPRRAGHRPDRREAAGLAVPGLVGDTDHLPGVDSPGGGQGGAPRQRLRPVEQRAGGGRLCGARLPLRHRPDRACSPAAATWTGSPCAAWLPRAPSASARWRASPITSGTWRCRWVRWWSAVSPA